jgi:triacylglycerol esterase/lipase EstA (alpha/beta hydrolase family)
VAAAAARQSGPPIRADSGSKSRSDHRPVVVYINGFLAPQNDLSESSTFAAVRIIQVSPSNVSSIHDRVMQIFYELKGGFVKYGEEHSRFHGHNAVGDQDFEGLYRDWDANNPVHLVGHSFGGLTARVFQHYLALGM